MAEQNNLNIWNIFKNEFNKVFQELLSLEGELSFENSERSIGEIGSAGLNQDLKHLKINITVASGENSGKMAFIYNSEVATSIEYFMLQGFSDKLGEIESSTLDANQEFTQTALDNVKNGIVAAGLPECSFKVENVEEIEDISTLKAGDMTGFTTYDWNQNAMEHSVSESVFILFDEFTHGAVFSKEEEASAPDEQTGTSEPERSPEKKESHEGAYVVEIEDCDQRKTIFKEELDNLKLILNVELKLTVRIGTKLMLLKDIVNIDIGTTIELEQMASDPLDILINGVKIAEGEVVVVEGKFGIQIVRISSKIERLSKLKIKQ